MQDKYDQLIKDYLKQLPNEKYIFEITKCCNYSTLVMVNRRGSSLLDLYKEVSNWFECRSIKELYLVGPSGEHVPIPVTNVVEIRDYILFNPTLFVPIYPIPNWVVYRIHLDDGHSHTHTEECKDQI